MMNNQNLQSEMLTPEIHAGDAQDLYIYGNTASPKHRGGASFMCQELVRHWGHRAQNTTLAL